MKHIARLFVGRIVYVLFAIVSGDPEMLRMQGAEETALVQFALSYGIGYGVEQLLGLVTGKRATKTS